MEAIRMIIEREAYQEMLAWKKKRKLQTVHSLQPRALCLEGP
jgi:hypothetical protein